MAHESVLFNRKISESETWDLCGHLKIGDRAMKVYCEDDETGPLSRLACCEACVKAYDESHVNGEECTDCKNIVLRGPEVEYYPRDFDPYSGDKPLIVCRHCREKEPHLMRLNKDAELCVFE